jgi:serine/threonine-protein kinase HipA
VSSELVALAEGEEIGRIRRDTSGRLKFIYAESWRRSEAAYPLSLSMPLAAAEHGHAIIDAFLWGLLPDNEQILDRWAKKFQVSARSAFALIAHVGEDCAGAVQFVLPDRIDSYRNAAPDRIAWLTASQLAQRLRSLRSDFSAWRAPGDTGQFSLAGAQAKTALLLLGKRWGVPSGRTPTTHILKPPSGEFDGHAENEHFCLTLARALGLPTPSSQVRHFEDEVAIVVERYDRVRVGKRLLRVHQEDMCQALGIPPTQKYENEGGPDAKAIVELVHAQSSSADEDIASFMDAIAFNWLMAGTDGHAKNYSILIGATGKNRLAPLYDLASALPYKKLDPRKLKLAMKIGGEYQLHNIGLRNWQRFAKDVRLDDDALVKRVRDMAARLPDDAAATHHKLQQEGLAHPIVSRLADAIAARAQKCEAALGKSAATKT